MAKIVLRFIKAARYPRNGIVNITVPSTCSVLTGARSSPSFASPFVISVLPSLRTTRCVTKLSFRLYVMISPIFGSFLFVSVNTSPPVLIFGSMEPDSTISTEIPIRGSISNSRPASPSTAKKSRPAFSAVFINPAFLFM